MKSKKGPPPRNRTSRSDKASGKASDERPKRSGKSSGPKRSFDRSAGRPTGKPTGPTTHIPEIGVLIITGTSEEGEMLGEPVNWDQKRKAPHIVVTETGRDQEALIGDRVLAKMRKISPQLYQALIIKLLPTEQPKNVLGVFVATADGGIIEPISRKQKESFMVSRADMNGALHGELVSGVSQPGVPSMGMSYAKIIERLGKLDTPRAASLIAASIHELPSIFSPATIAESEAAESPTLTPGREDLRNIPLVTIDGEDARDFDDAVFAEADTDSNNPGGWHIIVAIADVAHYVKEGSALDADAFERGNSVYFPDRVIPMLPERLSNGLCSLVPNEDRFCLAVHIWLDAQGNMRRYRFIRGLMRSAARLTYTAVQAAYDANATKEGGAHPLWDSIIAPLYAAYAALAGERDRRGALDLNLPEYKIYFDEAGNVSDISARPRMEANRLIECYMIAANVAAADYLLKNNIPAIYRVHEPPAEEKLEDLQNFLKMSGYSLHVGAGIRAAHFNRVLHASENQPDAHMIHTSILRSQMQAYYSHENLGHFGLSLEKYGHFTSPIRRYADLVVHRALAGAIDGSAQKESKIEQKLRASKLADISLHISDTERRAMLAERDASDRYKVAFMSRHIGESFSGTINSLNEYGLFVSLNNSGITGFIPVRSLPGDFYHFDKRHACFKGQRTKNTYTIGQPLTVTIASANAITGSLIFEPQGLPGHMDKPLRPGKDRYPKPHNSKNKRPDERGEKGNKNASSRKKRRR